MNIFKMIYYWCKVRLMPLTLTEFNDLCYECAHSKTSKVDDILAVYFYRHNVSKEETHIIFHYGFIIMSIFVHYKCLRQQGFPQEIFNYLVENKQFERLQRYSGTLKFTPEQEIELIRLVKEENATKICANSFVGVLEDYLQNGKKPFSSEKSQQELVDLDQRFILILMERHFTICRATTDRLMKKLEQDNNILPIRSLLCYGFVASEVYRNALSEKYDLRTEVCISEIRKKVYEYEKNLYSGHGGRAYKQDEYETILQYRRMSQDVSFDKEAFFRENISPLFQSDYVSTGFIAWIVFIYPTKEIKEQALDRLSEKVFWLFEISEINCCKNSENEKYCSRCIRKARFSLSK